MFGLGIVMIHEEMFHVLLQKLFVEILLYNDEMEKRVMNEL